jgi:hypothetical protein
MGVAKMIPLCSTCERLFLQQGLRFDAPKPPDVVTTQGLLLRMIVSRLSRDLPDPRATIMILRSNPKPSIKKKESIEGDEEEDLDIDESGESDFDDQEQFLAPFPEDDDSSDSSSSSFFYFGFTNAAARTKTIDRSITDTSSPTTTAG